MSVVARNTCRNCGSKKLHGFLDLGEMPPANSYLQDTVEIAVEPNFPLSVQFCEDCNLAQVTHDVDPELLFKNYAYFSSFSTSWLEHARDYSLSAIKRFDLKEDSYVIEIASNDGYLLKNLINAGVPCLGVDPSDTVARQAIAIGVPTEIMFFSSETAKTLLERHPKADLIIGNNVLAHVPEFRDFVRGLSILLAENGTVNIEFPHLLKLIQHIEFDTIYHEHFSYLSLLAVEHAFDTVGLKLYDVDELTTHGGSLRIYGCHKSANQFTESDTLRRVRDEEKAAGLDNIESFMKFAQKVEHCRTKFSQFLDEAKAAGKTVCGYGAAAKGNTFFNYCGTSATDIPFVVDRNPHKQGTYLPGSHIPVLSPDTIQERKPDYVLILPWNLKDEIMKQLQFIREWGGKFVVAIPEVAIL